MYVFLDQRFTNHVHVASVPTVSSHFELHLHNKMRLNVNLHFVTLFMLLIHCVAR